MPYFPERKPEQSGQDQEPEKKQKKPFTAEEKKMFFNLFLVAVSCVLILFGAVSLVRYGIDMISSRNTSRDLREVSMQAEALESLTPEPTVPPAPPSPLPTAEPAPTVTATPAVPPANASVSTPDPGILQPVPYPDNPDLKVSSRFRQLRRKSGYIIGWITLDGVDEPVALKDNSFFLNHDVMGKKNVNGAIFLDEEISLLTRPYTVYLYGHNMKSGYMFGKLKKYKESAYCLSHRIITFDTLYEDGKYAVFAVAEIDTVPGKGAWFDLWSLNTARVSDREAAIRTLENRSVYRSVLDVQADDQILVLVTCLDGDTERLIVAARRLREGETENTLAIRRNSR